MLARRKKPAAAPVSRAARATLDKLESRVLFVAIAETLLVDIDATDLPAGTITSIPNAGTTGGEFRPTGAEVNPATAPVIGRPIGTSPVGTQGIVLDGNDFLQHVDPETGFGLKPADPGIVGADPTRTVEAWVWNQFIADEETMVSWGRRGGPDGSNMSFNYGSSPAYGAIGHWGPPDIGYGATTPVRAKWHHLVYTYDGATNTTRIYVDGVQTNTETLTAEPALNTYAVSPVTIGAQIEPNGTTVTAGLRGSLTLGRVRIHDGVLSAADVAANYAEEVGDFVEPEVPPPPPPPPAVLVVGFDATTLPEGPVTDIPTTGSAGGTFRPTGGSVATPSIDQPLPASTTGTRGIRFDGNDYLQHVDAEGNLKPAPDALVGVDPKSSIEAWVWNPSVPPEETILAWGRRGNDGRNMSFNYGDNGAWGAMGHWGGSDIGWGPAAPSPREWHHVVHTFDGTNTRIYIDGVQTNSEELAPGTLNIVAGIPIILGAQMEPNGVTVTPTLRGDLTIGRASIYTGVLTPEQIAAKYAAEKPTFVEPDEGPAELTAPPIIRYSFSNAEGAGTSGTVIEDLIGDRDATLLGEGATFTGTRVSLPGGPSATAPYVDLPNNLLYNQSADLGGTGLITLEGWTRHTGSRTWGRFFDLGTTTGNVEFTGPGGTGAGTQYWMLAQAGNDVNFHRTELIVGANNPSNRTLDENAPPFQTDIHWVASWNEATGEVTVYEQGVELAKFSTPLRFSSINDINNFLGRSNFTADANFQGEFDEFRVYDRVLTAQEVQGNFRRGPDALTGGGTATITELYVRGSAWQAADANAATTTFMEYLEAKGLGDDVLGYRLYANGAPTVGPTNNPEQVLPWINTDEIVIRYSSAPTGTGVPTPGTLNVNGQRNGAYTITSVTPVAGDPTAFVLRLAKPLGGGDPVTGVAPTTTENGDRVTITVPGAGAAGANFSLRMNVLQGDVDHLNETQHNVLARDYAEVKKRFFKNSSQVPSNPDTDYTPFHDVDGNGQILARDYAEVKKRFFQNLPALPVAGGEVFSATRVADEILA